MSRDVNILDKLPLDLLLGSSLAKGIIPVQIFGRNADVDAAEDIIDVGGDFVGFPTGSAETVACVSSSASDAAAGVGARTILVEGLDSTFAIQSEIVVLNGATPVNTVATYIRISRVTVLTAGSSLTNVGTIKLNHSTTTANIFTQMIAGMGRSEIAVFTVPVGKRLHLMNYEAEMHENAANSGVIGIFSRPFLAAAPANLMLHQFKVSTTSPTPHNILSGLIFDAKTDLKFRCLSVTNANSIISVRADGYLIDTF